MANGYLSNSFADLVVAAIFAGDTAGLPTSLWVGLTLALPTDNNGTGLVAPSVDEYGRVEIVCEGASWISMGSGSRSMESAIDILFATAVTNWGQILGYDLHDAETDGIYLGYGITNPYTITAGMTPRLPAGVIVVSMPTTT